MDIECFPVIRFNYCIKVIVSGPRFNPTSRIKIGIQNSIDKYLWKCLLDRIRDLRKRGVYMEEMQGTVVDKKFLLVMILVCLALGTGFTFIYLDLKAGFADLKDNYANLSAEIEQLESTLEALHYNQTMGLTAVQIYNLTKTSVVLITNSRNDGSVVEGSGFVYPYGRGYIVTNNHVVKDYDVVKATFINGTVFTASSVYYDAYSDLAVLKINVPEEMQLHPLPIGNSSRLLVGETVYAMGNPFRLIGSITQGIVSQIGRSLMLPEMQYAIVDVIQIDAAINPGNSGGPLLNSLGFVVGVNFAIISETGEFSGVGFAISSVIMQRVIPALIINGTYEHPWIGVEGTDVTTDSISGFQIIRVLPDSPAQAKLQSDDIIIGVDNIPVRTADDLVTYMERYKSPGETIILSIIRDSQTLEIELELGVRPPP
ncbi:MAG: trypsin-like peptidase domain-containing protein [Candidatus Bathyarchaeota archaeon]|nr:trypsin-like peptidase domain-containing protein [Candidatus Bathyarchaeota archaeon]